MKLYIGIALLLITIAGPMIAFLVQEVGLAAAMLTAVWGLGVLAGVWLVTEG